MEHRWGTRSAVSQRGYVHAPVGLVAPLEILNVSISGCLVDTPIRPPLLARVQLLVPPLRGRPFLQGQIVRHTERGFAIEWRSFLDTGVLTLLARRPPPLGVQPQTFRASGA